MGYTSVCLVGGLPAPVIGWAPPGTSRPALRIGSRQAPARASRSAAARPTRTVSASVSGVGGEAVPDDPHRDLLATAVPGREAAAHGHLRPQPGESRRAATRRVGLHPLGN